MPSDDASGEIAPVVRVFASRVTGLGAKGKGLPPDPEPDEPVSESLTGARVLTRRLTLWVMSARGLTARVGAAVATMGDAPSRSRRSSAASVSHASLMVEGGGCRCSQERARRCRVDAAGVAGCAPRMVAVNRARTSTRVKDARVDDDAPRVARGRGSRSRAGRARVAVASRSRRGNKRDEGVSCRRPKTNKLRHAARQHGARGFFVAGEKVKLRRVGLPRDRRRSRIPTSASGQGPQPASSE